MTGNWCSPHRQTCGSSARRVCVPLKSERNRRNYTLGGRTEAYLEAGGGNSLAPIPLHGPDAIDTSGVTERWHQMGELWVRVHIVGRTELFYPSEADVGPARVTLQGTELHNASAPAPLSTVIQAIGCSPLFSRV